jgi:chromate transporter
MPDPADRLPVGPPAMPSFRTALKWWFRLGCLSFGGPVGQIALMHRELVERRRWISDDHFLHALNFCMLLPGPEAQQLATYLGWRLHGAKGGIAAGALFVLPSALLLFLLSWLYMAGQNLWWIAAAFAGLAPAVVALILAATLRIGRKALHSLPLWLIAATSFIAIHFSQISFILILAASATIGSLGHHYRPDLFPAAPAPSSRPSSAPTLVLPPPPRPSLRRSLKITAITLTLWWLPVLTAALTFGPHSLFTNLGLFFSKAALITFGGAYAVLPYVSQQAVDHHWLSHHEMITGLALAESTPGPLIMVLQFVGFAAGWHSPQPLPQLAAASLAAAITSWCTFLPGFLMVFLGAPHIESLHHHPRLSAALHAITAAVVGVILNLALSFSSSTIFPNHHPDWTAATLTIAAFLALEKAKLPILPIIASAALIGLLRASLP